MRYDATARGNFLWSDGKAVVDLTKQHCSISGVKTSSNSGGANQGSLPAGLYCYWRLLLTSNALEASPLIDCATVLPAAYLIVTRSPD